MKIRTKLTLFFTVILFVMVLALSFWYQYRLFYFLRQETEKNLDKFSKGLLGYGKPGEQRDFNNLEVTLREMQNRDDFTRMLSKRTWFTLYDKKMHVLTQTPFAEEFPLQELSSYLDKEYFTVELNVTSDYYRENNIESPPEYRLKMEHEFYTEEDTYTFYCLGKITVIDTRAGEQYFVVLFPENQNVEYLNKSLTNVIFSLFISVCIIIVLGLFYSKYALNPINKIIHELNNISEKNMSQRITLKNKSRDEISVISLSINNLLDRIENAFNMEKQFISDVSHEFKTPISILQLNTESLGNNPHLKDNEIDKISSSLEILYSLNSLIQKLLYLSRLESNLCAFKPETISVRELLTSIIDRLQIIAEKKNLKLSLSMTDEKLAINGDHELLHIALYNIIENALKYTDAGHVLLSARKNDNTVSVVIEDSGIGIPQDKIDRIFDKFYRVDSTRRDSRNFGIGLTIAKRILDIHGAEIHVESREKIKTVFTIKFK